jgi:hypothetical protein
LERSRGKIRNITVTGAQEALYAASSDVEIQGGTFSSTGQSGIKLVEGSRFEIESNDNDVSITSSAGDAIEVRSSFLRLDKDSNNLTISSTASGRKDIRIRERSTVDLRDHTYANVKVTGASYLHIENGATVTTLNCANASIIHNEGTVTNTSECANTNYISD